jgi:hypothetical protein
MINEKYPNTVGDVSSNQIKTEFTKYSKAAPMLNADDLRDRN